MRVRCFALGLVAAVASVGCREHDGTREARAATVSPPSSSTPAKPVASAAPGSASAAPTETAPQKAPAAPEGPRLYAKSRFVWVWPEPVATGKNWIGFLWTGSSVALKSTTPRPGPGCKSFYEIEPYGWVCVDERKATLDPNDATYRALAPYAPRADSPEPHRYGESIGLPRYFETPTEDLQRKREPDLASHLADVERARAGEVPKRLEGVDVGIPTAEPPLLPTLASGFFEDRRRLLRRSTVAYSTEARFGNRGFLLGADFAWVPKDRVVPYPKIAFRGLSLGDGVSLPLAYFRGKDRPKYARSADGTFSPNGATFPRLGWVALTGKSERKDEERYLETREDGIWIRESEAVVPRPRKTTPWGTLMTSEEPDPARARRKWVEISIEGGWLLAFEGTRPVYVTMMSPGRGGAAVGDENPLDRSATPTGTYSINGKLVTATMEAPGEYIHSDVPFAQNLIGPYAMHTAYWHDNWGKPQSGGCINLSPIDGKWLFDFTEPRLPQGWHAIRLLTSKHTPTAVVLHR